MPLFKRALESNSGELIHCVGSQLYYVSGSGSINVEINGKRNRLEKGQGIKLSANFNQVLIESDVDQNVEIIIETEEFFDSRVVGDVSVSYIQSGVHQGFPVIEKLAGESQVIAAYAGQRELILKADRANTGVIWTGGLLGYGIGMDAGDVIVLSTSGNVTLYFQGDGKCHFSRVF